MVVFLCGEQFDHILCAVYEAWDSGLGHKNVKLQFNTCGNLEMFCQYREVPLDEEKAKKVLRSVRSKISWQAARAIYEAAMSRDENRADWIYRFLVLGFHYGREALDMLQYEPIYRVFELSRAVRNEAHSYIEFLRFSRTADGVFISRIKPKNDILALIAPHFSDRLPGEHWVIYDVSRKRAAFNRADTPWFLMDVDGTDWEERLCRDTDEREYEGLWKAFFDSIAIEARINPRCQRTHLPLRYREFMTEFRKERQG